MSKQLRKAITDELHRRHGYRVMEAKIKPVHIANALMRVEHECVGKMNVLQQLFEATVAKNSLDQKLNAARLMLDAQRDRWGALGQTADLKSSALLNKVLPLLRTLLGADGALFGTSPDLSSFSSPTSLTVTGDPSDDGAGAFVFKLWGGHEEATRLPVLDLLSELTSPRKDPAQIDDLSALLIPLVDSTRAKSAPEFNAEDLISDYSNVEKQLRLAASRLCAYERKLNPNPIASLQRVVLLAALSVFRHGATRAHERAGGPERFLLLDASGDHYSAVAQASTGCVTQLINDACRYMASVVNDLLTSQIANWPVEPIAAINSLLESSGQAPLEPNSPLSRRITDIVKDFDDPEDIRREVAEELIRQVEGNQRRGLDGYLRLLGIRSGFLYPTQKNPNKRLNPTDRTLEVLVASTVDVHGPILEYRDFLEELKTRWAIVVGGRTEDALILSHVGASVPAKALRENSERFLSRLESLGLARRLADSVAVVGLLEATHE
ncbi:hypothetical protein PPMP20_09050 [Paraburkholderia phymatum]|uniref:Uncharacterized protein n=1 Tax=Paraburkholderia phymatum (strain DSM 17167 / CIP 108236 / LMG 21445 / STM815) TaxID=391038 RepID=B2JC74_PARP8|nr:hypothetical protein [Paraburkholderia phymatum]ACC69438.1 hypothetical protein Bphy_0245 [Paraburkholderia phymatum STM815]